jgi:hypothetical protein
MLQDILLNVENLEIVFYPKDQFKTKFRSHRKFEKIMRGWDGKSKCAIESTF